jgi:hypothetical protein
MSTHQIKVYAGDDTKAKWERICEGYTSNVAAFAALVESYYWRHQMGDPEKVGWDELLDGADDEIGED